MTGTTTISGLSSGLQTDSIIAKLIEIEKRPIQQYQARQDQLRQQLSAYQEANTRLAALRDAAAALALPTGYDGKTVSSSDEKILTATAQSSAVPGDYQVHVVSLARSHQLVSQSYADLYSTRVGTGTFKITSGTQTTAITVDSSNNTLAGLRDAINRANTNVRASIVQESDSSYRLMLSAKDTGTANALTVTSTLTGGTNPSLTDLQAASDAQVQLGSGAGMITATSSSNTVADLVPGVTLNLKSDLAGNSVTVHVDGDTKGVGDAVSKFVDQYNALNDFFSQQFKFDSQKGTGGVLLGDYTLRNVQNDVLSALTSGVAGVTDKSLADIGITMGGDGKLALNRAKLEDKLNTDPGAVTSLLALTYKSTDVGVQLVDGGSAKTNGAIYPVNITLAATEARVTSGAAMNANLDANETLTINGTAVTLQSGMTRAQVVAAINSQSGKTGVRVSATLADGTGSGNYLTFTAASYGSLGSVKVISDRSYTAGATTGVGNVQVTQTSAAGESGVGTGAAGVDVAGTINGEAATGSGQILTGNAGNANTDGLKLRITSSSTGSLGTIQLFDGTANTVDRLLNNVLDITNGTVKSQQDSLTQQIDDLQKIIDDRNEAAKEKEDQLRERFAALESAMAKFQSQSSSLTAQLAGLR